MVRSLEHAFEGTIEPMVFVDTGAWYALVDAKDPDHRRVVACLREHRSHLVTSNFVFDETLTLVRSRLGWHVARHLGERLRDESLTRLVRVSPKDEDAAWFIFADYDDKSFSFTDCTSFAVVRRMNIPVCITLDSDFRSFGLHCIPR